VKVVSSRVKGRGLQAVDAQRLEEVVVGVSFFAANLKAWPRDSEFFQSLLCVSISSFFDDELNGLGLRADRVARRLSTNLRKLFPRRAPQNNDRNKSIPASTHDTEWA